MGGFSNWPNYDLFISQCWGSAFPECSGLPIVGAASNIVVGANPPYTASDFFGMCPNWGGQPTNIQGTLTAGTTLVTDLAQALSSNAIGQYLIGPPGPPIPSSGLISWPYIATGTTVSALASSPNTLTLSQNAVGSGIVTLNVYLTPLVPLAVLWAFIALAGSSLVQARWQSSWALGMMWYIQHFLTLYLRSNGDLNCTPGQIAAAGLKQGITVSASAGNVSQTLERTPGLDEWAGWNQTQAGVNFASMARIIGMGPMLVF